ncbi:MAG: PASTA domain-containing protein [Actinomycetota bacterium]|nr:PASTA domain-containing protein [Actinomycetota bacterium]
MQERTSDPLVGTLVDNRYQVHSRVARGGMSTVYLATDLRLDRPVALKVLHPHLATDSSFLHRLGSEAKAAARLSHPHVVGMLDQGDDGSLAYLVMEYIPGHTLRDVLREHGSLTPRLALAYLDAVVEGLGAAHAAGLVHRDVKPENVLIADDGRIKIGDFGLARAVTTTTNTGALMGTVAYLSPELVNGQPADARTDIYSVGIMLYEMLTGHQPFRGDLPIHVAMQHVTATVPAPSLELPGLSPDLDELVRCCTEKDPEARPADGDALLEDLRHIRTSLSDAELDYGSAAATVPPRPQRAPGSPTQLLAQPTEAISRAANPTTVMPAGQRPQSYAAQATGGQYGDGGYSDGVSGDIVYGDGAEGEPRYGDARQGDTRTLTGRPYPGAFYPPADTAPVPVPNKRAVKREDREAQKAQARAAARPSQTLRRGNPRRRGLVWLILLLVLALLAAGAGWFFGLGPGALATVPDVRNKTVAQAQSLLQAQGFNSTSRDVNDESVQQGLVVTSDPGPRTQQRRFQPVTLLVSKGPVLYAVPKLVGGTLDQAKVALNAAKLALGNVAEQYDEQQAAGVVLSQDPAPDVQKRGATPVNLAVSKGPTPIPVPNVVGRDKDDAVKALSDLGLNPHVAPDAVNDKKVPAGSVVSQDPANGTLTKGGTVTLTLSKGPKQVDVPNEFGKDEAGAVADLKALGFDVKVTYTYGSPLLGKVVGQDKKGKVPEGSTVNLTVV